MFLLSKDWIELLWNISLLGVLALLPNGNHKVGICLAIGVCWCQVSCLKYTTYNFIMFWTQTIVSNDRLITVQGATTPANEAMYTGEGKHQRVTSQSNMDGGTFQPPGMLNCKTQEGSSWH